MCDPCSKRRMPIPSIGITAAVRVCDRCYNGWGTIYGEDNIEEDPNSANGGAGADTRSGGATRPIISRRSAVVDELASRIPSI